MKQASAPPKSPKSWALYGCGTLLVLPLLLLLLLGLTYFLREGAARRELEAKLAVLKEQNLPVDNNSLGDFYHSLTDNSETEAWLTLISEVLSDEFNESTKGVPVFDGELDEEESKLTLPWKYADATRAFLDQHEELVQKAERMSLQQLESGAKGVNMDLQFDSFNTLLPNTQNMRQVARLLSLKATLAIHDGNSSSTRRAITALYGNAKTIGSEPFIVSQLVSLAIQGIAIDRMKLALEMDVLNERDLEKLLELTLKETNVGAGWQLGLQGERASALAAFDDPSSYGLGVAFSPARDSLAYLDLVDSAMEIETHDFDTMIAGLEQLELEVQSLSNAGPLSMLESRVTLLLTPAMSNYGHAFIRLPTQNRLMAFGIGLRLYEKKHGSFPAKLEELKADFPELDPAVLKPRGTQPFGYQIAAEGNSTTAQVWGFDSARLKSTPTSPPDQEYEGMWTITLPKSGPAEPE